jgi:uncharacterized damage-inducible protein DinB
MTSTEALRAQLASALDWADAHAPFEGVTEEFPQDLRGVVPDGLPYSAWQLVEHMRRTQADILAFCVRANYEELAWPADYWPDVEPPSESAWDECLEKFRQDRAAMQRLALDPSIDLFEKVPAGTGQTYLRELLLVADHNAYHLGQLVILRRLLHSWDPK